MEAGRRYAAAFEAARQFSREQNVGELGLAVALEARIVALGIEVREVVALRPSRAVEVTGRLRDSTAYLRVLSETAGAPPVAVATYYQLADVNDRVVMRFGFVEGFAPADRLVAWVQPDLLRH